MNRNFLFLIFMLLTVKAHTHSYPQIEQVSNKALGEQNTFLTVEKPAKKATKKLVKLMNKLAAKESNPLLKQHFESIALLAVDTTHGFQITEVDMKNVEQVLQFFETEGAKLETYVNGPRPLIMSFTSPTDGKISFYRLFLPKDFDKTREDYPLYLELHGSAGGKNNNPRWGVYMHLQPEVRGVPLQGHLKEGFHVYPWGRGDKGYRDIAETDIFEVLTYFDKLFTTDPTRQYMYGFSMGGAGTFRLAPKMIDRWAAIAFYSGSSRNPDKEQIKAFKNTPVWMAWGEEERNAVPMRQLKEFMLEEGIDLRWHEVKGVGHKYLQEYQKDLMDWFRTKVKE